MGRWGFGSGWWLGGRERGSCGRDGQSGGMSTVRLPARDGRVTEETPEYQAEGTCRVCGTKLTGRQRAFCSNFLTERGYLSSRRVWPEDGRTPCAYWWEERYRRTHWLRRHVFARAEYRCERCGLHAIARFVEGGPAQGDPSLLELHHIVPLEHGGGHEDANLQALCRGCHGIVHGGSLERGGGRCVRQMELSDTEG